MSKKRPQIDEIAGSGQPTTKKSKKAEQLDPVIANDELGLWCVARPNWSGLDQIKRLVVFGDSSTRRGNARTWLGHLLTLLRAQGNDVQAQCYAAPGNTAEDDIGDQLATFFEQFPAKRGPKATPSLDPDSTLYVVWLGINDCGHLDADDLEEVVEKLFVDGLEDLYTKAGARKFLLIDVPPKDRSPSGLGQHEKLSERYRHWNEVLQSRAKNFTSENKRVSLFLFSSYRIVSSILDDPEEYGFQDDDVSQEGGGIWADDLHLTSEVHAILAERLEKALRTADHTHKST